MAPGRSAAAAPGRGRGEQLLHGGRRGPGAGREGPGKQRRLEGAGPGDRRGGTVAMESPADTYKCLSHFLRVFSEETIG